MTFYSAVRTVNGLPEAGSRRVKMPRLRELVFAALPVLALCGVLMGAVLPSTASADQVGSLSLSLPTPYEDRALVATLADPDGSLSNEVWKWSWSTSRSGPFTDIANTDAASYTPVAGDVGRYLKAHVTYSDAEGTEKEAEAVAINTVHGAIVNAPPEFPTDSVMFTVDESAPSNFLVGSTVLAVDPDGDDLTYWFDFDIASGDSNVCPVNTSCRSYFWRLILFLRDFDWDEESGRLIVSSSDLSSLDYERQNEYSATLRVRDGRNLDGSASLEDLSSETSDDSMVVTVKLNNVDEGGRVNLTSYSPRLEQYLEAELSDPDGGIGNLTWQWSRSTSLSGTYEHISGADSSIYDVRDNDVGYYLKATASYGDAQGTGKSAQRNTTTPVPVSASSEVGGV